MISRVAESCFWLFRHMERVDSTARLLRVHGGMVLDASLPPERTWRPLLIVLGEEERFVERFGVRATGDGEIVQEYLTWDRENPVALLSSVWWARENARTIRETISLEMWNGLNGLWLWLKDGRGRRLYNREAAAFYEEVGQRCHQFHGACQNTMLHEEPFDFMRLGLNLERAGQVARILDLKHHAIGPTDVGLETAAESAEWIAILRSCLAYEPFFKKSAAPLSGPAVAQFLLLEPAFPGSVLHGVTRAWNFLRRIRPAEVPEVGAASWERLRTLLATVEGIRMEEVLRNGIHDVLTGIVDGVAEVCLAVQEDYFYAALPEGVVPAP